MSTVRTTESVQIDAEQLELIREYCEATNTTLPQVLQEAVSEYVDTVVVPRVQAIRKRRPNLRKS